MLSKLDARIAKALIGLENHPDWQIVRTWLQGNKAILQDRISVEREESAIRWIQGALQLLGDLFSKQDQAREVLRNYKNVNQSEFRGITGSYNEPL